MRRAFAIVSILVATGLFAAPNTARLWLMPRNTIVLSRHLGFVFSPDIRYELAREKSSPKGFYMTAFFTGPEYFTKAGKFRISVPFLYYYMGFPVSATNTYYYEHNIDIRPVITYRVNRRIFLMNKFVFHNTLYADIYPLTSQRKGYSLMLKYFLGVRYAFKKNLMMMFTENPIFGIIEDSETVPMTGIGFTEKGFDANKIFFGVSYKVNKHFSVVPQYCYEIAYKNIAGSKHLIANNHYVFLTLLYNFKI